MSENNILQEKINILDNRLNDKSTDDQKKIAKLEHDLSLVVEDRHSSKESSTERLRENDKRIAELLKSENSLRWFG